MRASGIWSYQDLITAERRICKKAQCVPNDINPLTLQNLVAHRQMSEVVERKAKELRRHELKVRDIARYMIKEEGAATHAKHRRREKIYFPRGMVETILALSRGRTTMYFGQRHLCVAHNTTLDDAHLHACGEIDLDPRLMKHIKELR